MKSIRLFNLRQFAATSTKIYPLFPSPFSLHADFPKGVLNNSLLLVRCLTGESAFLHQILGEKLTPPSDVTPISQPECGMKHREREEIQQAFILRFTFIHTYTINLVVLFANVLPALSHGE